MKGDDLVTCAWLVKMEGQNPVTGEIINDETCAIAAIPTLLYQVGKEVKGSTIATEVFMNAVTGLQRLEHH